MITRTWAWSPASTPSPQPAPGSVYVNTNGRGAPVWVPPRSPRIQTVPAAGQNQLMMRPPKLMMDPIDASTWQRPYRFT